MIDYRAFLTYLPSAP